jgi:muramoyltetrapeptide carboxypeptidase LdcA involved in peptidoglycan recycling
MFPRPSLVRPPILKPGDKVAILSPSWTGPGVFPHVQDLGLKRLREHLQLEPVEYPTTRKIGATPQERAADIHAAFADPEITAIMASIGGSDQITVLRYLDPAVLQANPKVFFGYSDNTNLLVYLWNLGIIGFYGGPPWCTWRGRGAFTRRPWSRCAGPCSSPGRSSYRPSPR